MTDHQGYQQNTQNQYYQPQQQSQYPPQQYSQGSQQQVYPQDNYNNQQPQNYQQPYQEPQQQQYQQPYQEPLQNGYHHQQQGPHDADQQQNQYINDPYLQGGLNGSKLDEIGFFERKGFVVKVYTLLTFQLFITFALTLGAYLSQGWRDFLCDRNSGNLTIFTWLCFAIMFCTEIAIFCCKGVAKKVPNNYIALFIFTFTMSVWVAAICSLVYNFYDQQGGYLVMVAALLTFAVTAALTAYACTTKTDFTMMGGALWIIASVMLVVFIVSMFNRSLIWQLIVCGLVIVCYGFYLIYDTQLIVGGKQHELAIDDYIIASMLIYIDIIILFLRILQILLILFGKK